MSQASLTTVVEGMLDEAVVARLLAVHDLRQTASYPTGGETRLDQKIQAYNAAAQHGIWLVLRDLDSDAACPGELVAQLLPKPAAGMCLQLAVRQVEAWLLADHEALAAFLKLGKVAIEPAPERLVDAKRSLVKLAGRSRSGAVRRGMVPSEGSGRRQGPQYTDIMSDFAARFWSPGRAAARAPSLARMNGYLDRLARTGRWPVNGRLPDHS